MNEALTPYTPPQGVTLVDIRMDANRFPRIKTLSMQSAVARLEQVLLMAYTYTGRPAQEGRTRAVASALYNELLEDKKHLGLANITIEEVAHAVKDSILQADEDIFINIAFLYKAVCAYALGEGHDAQQTAYKRKVAERQRKLDASPAGTMLTAYAGALLKESNPNLNSK